jgi:hypothetical protein
VWYNKRKALRQIGDGIMFDENTISENIMVGRRYMVTAFKCDDNDMNKARIVIRNSNNRIICTTHRVVTDYECHLKDTAKNMMKIMHLLNSIEDKQNDDYKELLIEWVDSTMKYWGTRIYELLYDEFGYILQGKNLKTHIADNLQDLKDGYMEVYMIDRGLSATYSPEFGKFTITYEKEDDTAEQSKDIYIYSNIWKCVETIMMILGYIV